MHPYRGVIEVAVRALVVSIAVASCTATAQPAPPPPTPPAAPPAPAEASPNERWTAARYDACLDALGSHVSHSPYLEVVRRSPLDKAHLPYDGWNINLPHKKSAINLLVPDGELAALPDACGSAPASPTCWSYPNAGDVLCNPAMGRHLSVPEQEPPSDIHTMVAFRFLFFMTLGHELGHLELERALNADTEITKRERPQISGNLNCFPFPENRSTIEAQCDEIGIRLGCSWLLNSNFATPLVFGNPREDLKLLVAVHALAETYHKGDELCRGDPRYASISARIERFGTGIIECFNPKRDSLLFELSRQAASAYAAADDSMRRRQLAGWPASSLYGRTRIQRQRVAGARRGPLFLDWIETSAASSLQIVRAEDGRIAQFSSHVAAWKPAARLVSIAATSDGWRAVVDAVTPTPGQRRLETHDIRCSDDRLEQCASTKVQDLAWRGDSRLIAAGAGFIASDNAQIQVYATPDDLARGVSTGGRSGFSPGSPFELVAALPDGGALGMAFRSDGLFIADMFTGGNHRFVSLPFPMKKDLRISALHVDSRHVLVFFQRRDLTAWDAYALWDCPPNLLAAKRGSKIECHTFDVPAAMKYPLVIATETEDAFEPSRIEPLSDAHDKFALSADGWTWLIDLTATTGLLIPAQGVARVDADRIYSYRAGRLDAIRADWLSIPRRIERLTAE